MNAEQNIEKRIRMFKEIALENKIQWIGRSGEFENEAFTVEFMVCTNPFCHCSSVDLLFSLLSSNQPQYNFSIDVSEKKITDKDKLDTKNKAFAKTFMGDCTEDDWHFLQKIFWQEKKQVTETADIHKLEPPIFPIVDIEDDSLLIGYHEIFPYAPSIEFSTQDVHFVIDDQYCLNTQCACRSVAIQFIDISKGKDAVKGDDNPMCFFDYKKISWEFETAPDKNQHSKSERELAKVVEQTIPDLPKMLKKRHEVLRLLYKRYRKESTDPAMIDYSEKPATSSKIGRNAPCPCGSNKKYKKCCGR